MSWHCSLMSGIAIHSQNAARVRGPTAWIRREGRPLALDERVVFGDIQSDAQRLGACGSAR
jgi:hypothetical protein